MKQIFALEMEIERWSIYKIKTCTKKGQVKDDLIMKWILALVMEKWKMINLQNKNLH